MTRCISFILVLPMRISQASSAIGSASGKNESSHGCGGCGSSSQTSPEKGFRLDFKVLKT